MLMPIHLVYYVTGEYADHTCSAVRGFTSPERAQAYADEMNTWLRDNNAHREQQGTTVFDFDGRPDVTKRLRVVLGFPWIRIDYTGGSFMVDQEPIPVEMEP